MGFAKSFTSSNLGDKKLSQERSHKKQTQNVANANGEFLTKDTDILIEMH